MAKDAFYFLIPILAAVLTALLLGWVSVAIGLVGLALFILFFFRDPRRSIPAEPGVVVSPADGKVVRINREGDRTRISVFLSLFNVHVNRAPIGGRISRVRYQPGRFHAAFSDRASWENEQNTLTIEGEGMTVECAQIAGIVARRIVCWRREGDYVERGERYGLIRFGSRADIVIGSAMEVTVAVGDRVRGGASVIARRRMHHE